MVLKSVVSVGGCLFRIRLVSPTVSDKEAPFLFAVYLDDLISELTTCGVGCYWGTMFAGCVCYADDTALLAPCPSALRLMLNTCCNYVSCHGLEFNTTSDIPQDTLTQCQFT